MEDRYGKMEVKNFQNIVWKIKNFNELTVQDLYKILKSRIDVFVVEQNCPYPDLDGYDDKAIHLWAE